MDSSQSPVGSPPALESAAASDPGSSAARRAVASAATSAAMTALTEGPLAKGVLIFGLPLVLGMFLHTTFNLVDMFIIGQLPNGTEALAAVAICDMLAGLASI